MKIYLQLDTVIACRLSYVLKTARKFCIDVSEIKAFGSRDKDFSAAELTCSIVIKKTELKARMIDVPLGLIFLF